MVSDPVIGLRGVAGELNCHPDTVRKAWRAWRASIGFPAPCKYPPPGQRGRLGWRLAAIVDWKLARERALGEGRSMPLREPALADSPPVLKNDPRLARERAQLHRLLERA